MKKNQIVLTTTIILLGLTSFVWACPGGDPQDPGVCDTLFLVCHDSIQLSPPPWEVHFSLLVTHDVPNLFEDSICWMMIAFDITHTNPTAYCSIPGWRNHALLSSDTANSVFRHFGGMQNRMMNLYEQGNGAEWDSRIVDAQTEPPAHFWFGIVACGLQDQRWWEGNGVLLATMTFIVSDTMIIHIDNGYWPPNGFPDPRFCAGHQAPYTYTPRHNLPLSVKIYSVQRWDTNGDGMIDLGDVLHLINYLYKSGPAPDPLQAGDCNCDGVVDSADVLLLINYLYKGGPPPDC